MRFTIRDLFWLTVVVALGVGWWVDRGRLVAEVEELRRQLVWDFNDPSVLDDPPPARSR